MVKVPCGKCGGQGTIGAFKPVAGGVCFSCAGVGYHLCKKPPTEKEWFQAWMVHRETGEMKFIWGIKGTSQADAMKKAMKKASSPVCRMNYDHETLTVKDWPERS